MKVLMMLDMQVDFVGAEGVYARSGVDVAPAADLVRPLSEFAAAARRRDVPVLASRFTILEDRHGEVVNLGHVADLRPFLLEEGFRRGTAGHRVDPGLPEPDVAFDKYRFSPFFGTPLGSLLRGYGATHLVLTGIATHGAVESCARDAVMRDYEVTVVSDLCGAYRPENHRASLTNLESIGELTERSAVRW